MSAAVASARIVDGGLQLRNVHDELLLLSARTVQRWLSAKDPILATAGHVLRSGADPLTTFQPRLAPARGPLHAPRLATSLASSGTALLTAATCSARQPDERAAVLALLSAAGRTPLSQGKWERGWYCRDYAAFAEPLAAVRNLQASRFGEFNRHGVLEAHVLGSDLLLHVSGSALRASHLPGLPTAGARVADLLEIQWDGPQKLRFRYTRAAYLFLAVDSFCILCDMLVMCYPALLDRHDPPAYLQVSSVSNDRWFLPEGQDGVSLVREYDTHQKQDLGHVLSMQHAERLARSATGLRQLAFKAHPALSPILPVWGSPSQWSARALRALVSATSSRAVLAEVAARDAKIREQSPPLADALALVKWKDIPRLPHSSSRQQRLFHRIKGAQLAGWDRVHERWGCPHCLRLGAAGGSVMHIIWACPAAQRLWTDLRSSWSQLGLWTSSGRDARAGFFSAVFSLRLARVPPRLWNLRSRRHRPSKDSDDRVLQFPGLCAIWQQTVLETLIIILAWRNGLHDTERAWSEPQARVAHDGAVQRVLDALGHRLASSADADQSDVELAYDIVDALGYTPSFRRTPETDEAPGHPCLSSLPRQML